MKDRIFNVIAQFIYERSRLSFSGHKKTVLRHCLEDRMKQVAVSDLQDYWDLVRTSPQEVAALFDLITTNETVFFRNKKQFEYLMDKIIPGIEAARGQEVIRSWGGEKDVPSQYFMKLRLLCAGCSTGEEPYSLAMALLESLRFPKAWDVEILAGDLSDRCIAKASGGYYENDRLKGVPREYLEKYMERTADGAVVRDEVKRLIRFCHLNLGAVIDGGAFPGVAPGFAGFDIIFCRNVMIYFSPESQQKLVDALSRSLAPGGYFFTGDAEPLHLYSHELETVRDAGCLIYRKSETAKDAKSV